MKNIIIAAKLFLLLTLIVGIIYPFSIYLFGIVCFNEKTNGSLITRDGCIIGSELLGQRFSGPEFFWGRPSAVSSEPMPSGGSNLNPIGTRMKEAIAARIDTLRMYHSSVNINDVPKDLLFASGSGVDPHISPEAALFQIDRISARRHFNEFQKQNLKALVNSSIEGRSLRIFGEPRVNVLELNIKLIEFAK